MSLSRTGLLLIVTFVAALLAPTANGLSFSSSRERLVAPFRKVASWVKDETVLVKSTLGSFGELSSEQEIEVKAIVGNVARLSEELQEEEERIHKLHRKRSALLLETPLWMFDKTLATKRAELNLEIAAEERKLFTTQDKVVYEMDRVKGIIGIYSWVFAADLGMAILQPMFQTVQFMLNTFFSSMLLFLFAFAPVLFTIMLFFVEVRRAIIPAYLLYHFALVAVNMPSLILKYNPNPVEFVLILLPMLQILAWFASKFVSPPVYFVDAVAGGNPKLHRD